MKPRWHLPVMLAGTSVLFWLMLDAERVHGAVREGLSLCAASVIPSLFPFLAVSSLLVSLGFGQAVGGALGPFMSLYRICGDGAAALVLGLLGGYPIGARTAAELYRSGSLSRGEAEHLLTFCNNANPAFFLSVLGLGVFHSIRAGLWLWLIHVFSALITGLLSLGRGAEGGGARGTDGRVWRRADGGGGRCGAAASAPSQIGRFSAAFLESVRSALGAILSICSFVVFFYVMTLPARRLPGPPGTLLTGALELFSAVPRITADRGGFVLAAGLSGWGGLSVLSQTMAVLDGSGLSSGYCAAGKAVQGLVSAALAAALAPYVLG